MKRFLSFTLLSILSFTAFSQQIVQVGCGEYMTAFRTSDGKLYSNKWLNSSSATSYDVGLSNVVDVSGAQYTVVALTGGGDVYVVGVSNTSGPFATLVSKDYTGAAFKGNTKVYGLFQCYLSIRDGKVWYWGNGDVLNQRGGANIDAPVPLTMPSGKTMKKLVTTSPTTFGGLSTLWGLATDGTLWQWDRSHTTPFQVTFPGNIAVDITMVDEKAFVIQTASDLYTWGYYPSYAGGKNSWEVSGIQNVKSVWQAAGAVFPLKQIAGNANSLHIIDANNNMFASGSMSQGEVGNGQAFPAWRTASNPWNWDWSNGNNMVAPTQIPGKFKNICTGNTIAFYIYAQDMGGNWYSWGRNKSFSLGNGQTLAPWGGQGYDSYPNALDVPAPSLVKPINQTWTVLPFNPTAPRPPFANAGVNQYISENTTTLYGSGSFQQEGSITKYLWEKQSGPAANIQNATAKNATVSGLTNGTYIFKLTVTNNNNATASSIVTVEVSGSQSQTPANQPPVANAGTAQTITLPANNVKLTGSATDADGTIASYSWVKISGPAVTIVSPSSATTALTNLVAGSYTFELTVKDDKGATATSTVKITVKDGGNISPVAAAGNDISILLPQNSVTLTGSGSDADGTISSYKWTKISGPTQFTIVSPSSASTSVNSLVQGSYNFELTVTDNAGAVVKDTVKVIVNAASNIAPVVNAGTDQNVNENVTITLKGTATDQDGSISSYKWTKTSGPDATIVSPTSATTTVSGLQSGVYIFTFSATDDKGLTASDDVQVTVNKLNKNTPPVVFAGGQINITLPSNSVRPAASASDADGSIVYYKWVKVSGPSNYFLYIRNSNTLTPTITGLRQGTYQFKLTVRDNSGAEVSDILTVVVAKKGYTKSYGKEAPDETQASIKQENATTLEAKIFPNPVQQMFTAQLSGFEKGDLINIVVTDISGKRFINMNYRSVGENDEVKINGSSLVPGMYVLQASSGSKKVAAKVVKAK